MARSSSHPSDYALRRSNNKTQASPRKRLALLTFTLFVSLASTALAHDDHIHHRQVEPAVAFSLPSSTLIPIDKPAHNALAMSPAVTSTIPDYDLRMKRKHDEDDGSNTNLDGTPTKGDGVSKVKRDEDAKTTGNTSQASKVAPTAAKKPTTSSSQVSQSPLPSPFDGFGGRSTTQFPDADGDNSCPQFMKDLLANPTFKSCYPLSMMMQTSNSLFEAEKNLLSIVRVLDATCRADVKTCTEFLNTEAKNLTASGNCKAEFDNNASDVVKAYRGLQAYGMLYSASCLQDPTTNMYCFANAFTNLTTPSNTYLYFMPYGLALPGSSLPSCNWCTQETMAIYHAASEDRNQPIANTYSDAARQVNTICGPNFVNDTLPDEGAGSAFRPSFATSLVVAGSVLFALIAGL